MKSYTYKFISPKSPKEVYELLLTVNKWWSGIYEENIIGKSRTIDDEFSFSAGGGAHFSKQRLIELVPNKKIVWLITESNLTFLRNPKEWNNTKLVFNISKKNGQSEVKFTHDGLLPQIECYDGCSNAWTQYLNNLKEKLKQ